MYTLKITKDGNTFMANYFKDGIVIGGCCSNVHAETFCQFCARMEQKIKQKEAEDSFKLIREKHMSLKLKKGDLVRVRSWDEMAEICGVKDSVVGEAIQIPSQFVPAMRELCGKVFSVSGTVGERVTLNGDIWTFSPAMLIKLDNDLKEVE
jgi:hypothetical protein